MKIIYVNTPFQGPTTVDPQIIDGKTPSWIVETRMLKANQTLRGYLEERWEYIKRRPNGELVEGFYLYDVEPLQGIMDKDKNFTGVGAMMVRTALIKKD